MGEPHDPDTEDRRPDHARPEPDEIEVDIDVDDFDVEGEGAGVISNDRWVDDDGELIDFDLDDLRGMDGPDA
jgi:hypothetical protein